MAKVILYPNKWSNSADYNKQVLVLLYTHQWKGEFHYNMNACSFIYWHWNSSAFIVAIVWKDKDSNYIIEWLPLKKARSSLRLPSTIELFSNTGVDQIAIHFVPLPFQKEYFLMFNIKKK